MPPGFCVTTAAYRRAVAEAGLVEDIDDALRSVQAEDPGSAEAASARFGLLFEDLPLPDGLAEAILAAYRTLGAPSAAVRTLRRLALELGRRLVESGSLLADEDVFFLETLEIGAAIMARVAGQDRPNLARLARERRELREARKRLHPPPVVPPGYKLRFGPFDMSAWETQRHNEPTGTVLRGFAVSPGRVSAPASVIHSPDDFSRMEADTILVCPTTTPAWTPLFSQARGLVTDVGGVLAHGSIVAREFGIPAVLGTGEASKRISHSQLITVDGDQGLVLLGLDR